MLDMSRSDACAIEGLPVRFIVALVVGVASVSVIPSMLSGAQRLATPELDVRPTSDVIGPGEQTLDSTIVDHEGNLMKGATVIVKLGAAKIGGAATAKNDDGGSTTANVDTELGANREDRTLVVSVKPPAGEPFVDYHENTNVSMVQD